MSIRRRRSNRRGLGLVRVLAVCAVASIVVVAGCGGSDNEEGAGTGTTTQASGADTDHATQVVEAGLESKMSRAALDEGGVVWTGADASPPPFPDATVATVPCTLVLRVCKFIANSAKEAATAMGWKTILVDGKSDPATEQAGVEAAINAGADCVLNLATAARNIEPQIRRGADKGVKFVTGFADDPRPFGGHSARHDYKAAGAALAAYVIKEGGGNIVVFSLPIAPSANDRTEGFVDFIEQYGGTQARSSTPRSSATRTSGRASRPRRGRS